MQDVALHYWWWILALLLIAVEVILPGYFLLWIGMGAAATGVVVLVLPGLSTLAQAVLFAVLAFLSCAAYWYGLRPRLMRAEPGDARLNRRGEQQIGQRYVLAEPIVHGRGKAKVGDGLWLVSGPDLPVGAMVEVVGVEGTMLLVKAAD
ncbi:NfeD family protein [Dyella sp. ASV21]|jgi:membrane protein implicated in regulation of membrane protease activity|uniref:NfeD family protein n=1 Tax=Dyella sp. ASV21 TaxID=2795114 RepID=UPI0018ECB600|nr:NfeD family protein [Dyella sp. ASV21]